MDKKFEQILETTSFNDKKLKDYVNENYRSLDCIKQAREEIEKLYEDFDGYDPDALGSYASHVDEILDKLIAGGISMKNNKMLFDADELKEKLIRCGLNRQAYDIVDREISYMTPVNAIPIPESATKGDIMQHAFPNYKFTFCGDWVHIELEGREFAFCPARFWNAPYEKE